MSRIIVITGATRGLGRAMAEKFIELGHVVAGCGRSTDSVEELNARHGEGKSWFAVVDVADDEAVAEWATRVIDELDAPDLLINNAGLMNDPAPLWQVDADAVSALIDVNLKGVVNVIRHFLPSMISRGNGVIVNMSSGWGRVVDADVAPYCATKWGIEGMTRALALDLPDGLAAVALSPGAVDTDMLRQCWSDSAAAFRGPAEWVEKAAPMILDLGAGDNGKSLTTP